MRSITQNNDIRYDAIRLDREEGSIPLLFSKLSISKRRRRRERKEGGSIVGQISWLGAIVGIPAQYVRYKNDERFVPVAV